jgi:iron complex transport system substrate-binding protein
LLLSGCVSEKKNKPQNGRIIRDKHGNEVLITGKSLQVMGLSPAITEMLFALLPDSNIAAVTPHCNFPVDGVKQKPVIQVMPLDFEAILKIRPSLVLTEEGITSEADFHRLKSLSVPVLMFSYREIQDITDAMDSIRVWTGSGKRAALVCNSLRNRLKKLKIQSAAIKAAERPRILALTWTNPIFAYGAETWMSEKMWLAGGQNALDKKLEKPYPMLEREQVLALDPDVIFGGSFGKMDSTFFTIYPELKRTKAYKNKKIYQLNDDLASRPGPRFEEGVKEISDFISR